MKWFLLTHVRKLFRLWCILGAVLWLAGIILRPDAPMVLFLLWMLLSSPLCLAQRRRKLLLSGGAALLTALLWSW